MNWLAASVPFEITRLFCLLLLTLLAVSFFSYAVANSEPNLRMIMKQFCLQLAHSQAVNNDEEGGSTSLSNGLELKLGASDS
jgi:hypothetical protein